MISPWEESGQPGKDCHETNAQRETDECPRPKLVVIVVSAVRQTIVEMLNLVDEFHIINYRVYANKIHDLISTRKFVF